MNFCEWILMLEKSIDEDMQPNGLATNYVRRRAESKVMEILRQNVSGVLPPHYLWRRDLR